MEPVPLEPPKGYYDPEDIEKRIQEIHKGKVNTRDIEQYIGKLEVWADTYGEPEIVHPTTFEDLDAIARDFTPDD